MTIPENDSDQGSGSAANFKLALTVGLAFAVLCAMAVFALLAIRAGQSAAAVGGLAVALSGAAATVAVQVGSGGRPRQRRSWGSSAATEDPHPGTGEPSERWTGELCDGGVTECRGRYRSHSPADRPARTTSSNSQLQMPHPCPLHGTRPDDFRCAPRVAGPRGLIGMVARG